MLEVKGLLEGEWCVGGRVGILKGERDAGVLACGVLEGWVFVGGLISWRPSDVLECFLCV